MKRISLIILVLFFTFTSLIAGPSYQETMKWLKRNLVGHKYTNHGSSGNHDVGISLCTTKYKIQKMELKKPLLIIYIYSESSCDNGYYNLEYQKNIFDLSKANEVILQDNTISMRSNEKFIELYVKKDLKADYKVYETYEYNYKDYPLVSLIGMTETSQLRILNAFANLVAIFNPDSTLF